MLLRDDLPELLLDSGRNQSSKELQPSNQTTFHLQLSILTAPILQESKVQSHKISACGFIEREKSSQDVLVTAL